VPDRIDAEVRLHGQRVGVLSYEKGGSTFRYEDDLTNPEHKTLGQIFEDEPRKVRRVRTGVPAWFANLLPEGALRRQVIREMGGGNIGDFTLLARLGVDLPGAVTVHTDDEPVKELEPEDPSEQAHPLRQSLAGVQLKYSVRADRLTFPARGSGGWWIVKLPDPSLPDLAVNEYLTMRWLQAAGLDVPAVELRTAKEVGGIPSGLIDPLATVYLVSRFDRTPAGRIHVEDFAQVADIEPRLKYGESGASYDGLAAVVFSLLGQPGYDKFIERLAAMLVVGNTDAHLKNWGLIYPDGRAVDLSPIYDFHSLTIYDRFRLSPLALSLNEERMAARVSTNDLRQLAERCGADPDRTAHAVGDAVLRLREAWAGDLRAEAESRFPALAEHFGRRLRTLPICQSS
jgi:serine/threonine-protein kinase HipA